MKALTIWQPWASLILAGAKPFEFRHWRIPPAMVGQRIGIHAGARPVRVSEIAQLRDEVEAEPGVAGLLDAAIALPLLRRWAEEPWRLPRSSIIATAQLLLPIPIAALVAAGKIKIDSDRINHGVWAWPLSDVQAVEPMFPARGAQGFWPCEA